MPDLFSSSLPTTDIRRPLPERMRPQSFEDVIGQDHLLGQGAPFRLFAESGDFPSIIFWGPPGVGKTTLAQLIAKSADYHFTRISAIEAGVKEVREIIAKAGFLKDQGKKSLLFIDEIHRFNKNQQDALLHAVEKGIITLIGATTENPSFEVNAALISRCQVYRLLPLENSHISQVIQRAILQDSILKEKDILLEDEEFLVTISGGDARTALNALELAVKMVGNQKPLIITRAVLEKALQQKTAQYDASGEQHYDTISAFIKSMRGSDPDAALFWLAKMIDAGEEPRFIARRMVIFASEDIGNADPFALTLAISVFQAVEMIGLPECRINLAQGVTYLATAPKSNASYMAIDRALAFVKNATTLSVPLHLRNAPTQLMKAEGYGKEYQYPHNYPNHFVDDHYFPTGVSPQKFYQPEEIGREKSIVERLTFWWPKRWKS